MVSDMRCLLSGGICMMNIERTLKSNYTRRQKLRNNLLSFLSPRLLVVCFFSVALILLKLQVGMEFDVPVN